MSAPHWLDIEWGDHIRDVWVYGRRLRVCEMGDGPPLLLIHGMGGCWQTWLENIPELATRHRVVAVDLPGFGASQPLPPPIRIKAYAEVMATLCETLDLPRVTVVAHSMGGLVTNQLAVIAPDSIERLILVNAGGVELSPRRLSIIRQGFSAGNRVFGNRTVLTQVARRKILRESALGLMLAEPGKMSPELAAELLPRMASPDFMANVNAAAKQASRPASTDIRCPVLLIWGAKDRILPLDLAKQLALDLPDASLATIADAGHCPMFEAPEEFNRLVLGFTQSDG